MMGQTSLIFVNDNYIVFHGGEGIISAVFKFIGDNAMKRIFVISILGLAILMGSAEAGTKKAKVKKIKEKDVIKSVNPTTPEKQLKLGLMYLNGEQVKKNYGKAKKWFFKSAMSGNVAAVENLGQLYHDGRGGWNYKKLFKTLKASAEKGNAEAMTNLGYLYRGGFGPKHEDNSEAVKWFTKAAEAGQASGMYYMGWMTYNGYGVPQNYNEAMNWYSKAAEKDYADAQYALAMIYMGSPAAERDYVEAYKWLDLAEKNGKDVFEDKYMLKRKLAAAEAEKDN